MRTLLPRAALDAPGRGVVPGVVVACRVVLHIPAVILLVDCREEDVVKPGLEVAIKEPTALLLLAVEPWEEEVERDVFEADKAAERVVRDLVNRL
jgi:hypothetical protein